MVRPERARVRTARGRLGRDKMVSEQTCRCTLGAEGSGKAGELSRPENGLRVPWRLSTLRADRGVTQVHRRGRSWIRLSASGPVPHNVDVVSHGGGI